VIPTFNEAHHIGGLLDSLLPFARRSGTPIIVADGGSGDATRAIVAARAQAEPLIRLLDNPARLQSAGINRAVALAAPETRWLIRVDAHAAYRADFCDILLAEAAETGADSVVVGMHAVGEGVLQRAIAAAQNSRFGNGGAAHRMAPQGRLVDHGHHALMLLAAFRAVGGYDESFSHNEDAELDLRLAQAGARIWLTARTVVTYYPRRSLGALARQYMNFGRGRAATLRKHRQRPRLRQWVVAGLAPALSLAILGPLHPAFVAPLALWVLGCGAAGTSLAVAGRDPRLALGGPAAGLMHLAWSLGFWSGLLRRGPARATAAQGPVARGPAARGPVARGPAAQGSAAEGQDGQVGQDGQRVAS